MAKLYNHTKWPDDLLQRIIARVARRAGARQGDVVVRVTAAHRRACDHGYASHASLVSLRFLRCQRSSKGRRIHFIKTDCGYVSLTLPKLHELDPVVWGIRSVALCVYGLIFHEFYHIREFQRGEWRRLPHSVRNSNGRRPTWKTRPEEIRANDAWDEYEFDDVDEGLIREVMGLLLRPSHD